jgi:hypothetical protein
MSKYGILQRMVIMKRKIAWLLGSLICLVILCVLFFLLDKPRINGFIQAKNRSIVYVHNPQSLIEMGVVKNSVRFIPFVSFLNTSFRIGDKIYCGYQNNIRVYDANYQFVKEIDIHTLGVPEGISLHTPVKIESGSMWWAAGKGVYGENPYFPPHLIIHITLSGESLRADSYDIGEFSAAAIQDDGNSILVFRKGQPSYENYNTLSKSITSKVTIKNQIIDSVSEVDYHDKSRKIIVCGYSDIASKVVIGYIKDQAFTLIDSAKLDLSGTIVGDVLFYRGRNYLYQYDLDNDVRKNVFAPSLVSFYSSYGSSFGNDHEENVLVFYYSYRDLIGRLYWNALFLNLTTKQYYLEKPMSPL